MSLCKQNKHKICVGKKKNKARVAKAHAAKKNLSESMLSGGAPVAGFARATQPQEGITHETPKSTHPAPKAQL